MGTASPCGWSSNRTLAVLRWLKALASAGIDVRKTGETPPTNVGIAGQSGMTVGLIEEDRNDRRCSWFWIVADNHRISAENTVALAEEILESENSVSKSSSSGLRLFLSVSCGYHVSGHADT